MPTLAATSSRRAAAKPRSANTGSAAARIAARVRSALLGARGQASAILIFYLRDGRKSTGQGRLRHERSRNSESGTEWSVAGSAYSDTSAAERASACFEPNSRFGSV